MVVQTCTDTCTGDTQVYTGCAHRVCEGGRDVFAWVPVGKCRYTNSVSVVRACVCAHVRGVACGYMSVPVCVYLCKWVLRVEALQRHVPPDTTILLCAYVCPYMYLCACACVCACVGITNS